MNLEQSVICRHRKDILIFIARRILTPFLLFCIINFCALEKDDIGSLHCLVITSVPFEGDRLSFYPFLLHIALCLYLIYRATYISGEQFQMRNYIFTRTTRQKSALLLTKRGCEKIAILLFTKILADLLFVRINNQLNFTLFIVLQLSIYITTTIWLLTDYALKLCGGSSRFTFFIISICTIICSILCKNFPALTIFTIASQSLIHTPLPYIAGKIFFTGCTIIFIMLRSKRYEVLGKEENE